MSSQRNSQRRSQSSTRAQLARDLHDSIAQDLVAIGYQFDLFFETLPAEFRVPARTLRDSISDATNRVRKELFALRDKEAKLAEKLVAASTPLSLDIDGNIDELKPTAFKILQELISNAASHSKGHHIQVEISRTRITVTDDGLGMFGVGELVDELGGNMKVGSDRNGTRVEITLP